MKQIELSLENLRQLEFGLVAEAFQRELAHCVKDLEDRPTDGSPRTVFIEFKLKPVANTGNLRAEIHLEAVEVQAEVGSKVPARRSRVYTMSPKHDGQLVFHPELPDEPNGSALFDDDASESETSEPETSK